MQEQRKFCQTDRWSSRDDGRSVSLLRPQRPDQPIIFATDPKLVETDLSRCAFLIIDMQNDFFSDDGWFATARKPDVTKLSSVIERINAIGQAFRAVGAPAIHINWAVRPDVANLPANVLDKGSDCGTRPGYGDKIASGPALIDGDWGAQSVADIEIGEQDISIGKDRLTGFRDNTLDQILLRLDVTTLFFAGVNLDRCVFATLADGCFNGFDAVLVEDATTTVSAPHVSDAILYRLRLLYGFTVMSRDILAAFPPHNPTGVQS